MCFGVADGEVQLQVRRSLPEGVMSSGRSHLSRRVPPPADSPATPRRRVEDQAQPVQALTQRRSVAAGSSSPRPLQVIRAWPISTPGTARISAKPANALARTPPSSTRHHLGFIVLVSKLW
eukprot:s5311_g2.t1